MAFDKLIAAGKKAGQGGMAAAIPDIHFSSNDKYFVIGNNRANVDLFMAKENNGSFDFYDKIKGSPIGGYANFQYIMASLRDEVSKDSLALVALDRRPQLDTSQLVRSLVEPLALQHPVWVVQK